MMYHVPSAVTDMLVLMVRRSLTQIICRFFAIFQHIMIRYIKSNAFGAMGGNEVTMNNVE